MSAPQLNLVVIRAADIDRAAAFYRAIGLEFTRHAHGSGPEHYASESTEVVFEVYPARGNSPPTTMTRLGFRVDSVSDVVERLASMGAEIVSPPSDSPWGRQAVVIDFDGHRVELTGREQTSS